MSNDNQFQEDTNIVQNLKPETRQKLSQEIALKWRHYTREISELISDSREAWDFYLRNHPDTKGTSRGASADSFNSDSLVGKGLRLGQIPKAVDSILSLIHNNIFPIDDRFFRGTPRNELSQQLQEPLETYLAENFEEAQISTAMRAFFHNLILDGTACAYVPYERKETLKTVYEKQQLDLGWLTVDIPWKPLQAVQKNVLEWEGTRFEPLDFNDWRIDPTARCIENSPFLRRWYRSIDDIQSDFPWLEKVTPYHNNDDSDSSNKHVSAGLPDFVRSIDDGEEFEGKEKALLMVCYDDFILEGTRYNNHIAVVLNDKELVWFGPNPYNHGKIPYIVAPYNPIPGQIYGISAVKHALPAAAASDKATNMILLNAWWGSNPIFMKNMRDAGVRKHGNIHVKPGMMLPVESFSAYQQLPINLANLSILENIIAKNEQTIQEVTGANPFIAGDQATQSNITAFEVDQRVQGGNSRFQSIMTNLANLVLEPYVQIAFENFQQFKTKTEIIGDYSLTPDDIRLLDFKWVTIASQATISRNRRIANMKSLLFDILPGLVQQGIVQLKPVGLEFDQVSALRNFLVDNGILDADKILRPIIQKENSPQVNSPPADPIFHENSPPGRGAL